MRPDDPDICCEAWAQACPLGLLALDADDRMRWLNPFLEELLEQPAQELLGKTPESVNNPMLGALVGAADLFRLPKVGTEARWLRRSIRQLTGTDKPPLQLLFFQDVSDEMQLLRERELLRQQVDELTLTDKVTGQANRRALIQALTSQVTRSRRYGNPLSLVLIQADVSNRSAFEDPLSDGAILAVGYFLRDRLRWVDVIGRYEPDCFMLILPETNAKAANNLVEKIRQEQGQIELPGRHGEVRLTLRFGATEWSKGLDPQRMISRAWNRLTDDRGFPSATGEA